MKVLVACEFSGIVRDAFAARGHDAWSCDLLPSERKGKHYQKNVLDLLYDREGIYGYPNYKFWNLVIAFPPCTDLAVSGARWFKEKQKDGRQSKAIQFFMAIADAPVEKIAIENPIGYHVKSMEKARSDHSTLAVRTWRNKSDLFMVKGIAAIKAYRDRQRARGQSLENATIGE